MISLDNYELLKTRFGHVASWAIWKQSRGSVKDGMGDLTVFDTPDSLQFLNPNVVFVGLNASGRHAEYLKEEKPWHNFHSGAPSSQSYKLRWALIGTPLWGGYITDIIKEYKEADSHEVIKHLKKYPELVQENIALLREELSLLSPDPLLIALGTDSYNLLAKHLGGKYRIERITHYSMQFSYKEIYPAEIGQILKKYGMPLEPYVERQPIISEPELIPVEAKPKPEPVILEPAPVPEFKIPIALEENGVHARKIDWTLDVDGILNQFLLTLRIMYEGTELYALKDSAPSQKHVSIYRKGERNRIAYLKPKKQSQKVDVRVQPEILTALRQIIELPEDTDVKKGKPSEMRNLKDISTEKSFEIFEKLTVMFAR